MSGIFHMLARHPENETSMMIPEVQVELPQDETCLTIQRNLDHRCHSLPPGVLYTTPHFHTHSLCPPLLLNL